MSNASTGHHDDADRYEIRLQGHLGPRWSAWFDGLSVINEPDGNTVISGPVADQAALHGLLQKARDVGLPLVSVTSAETDQPDVSAVDPRQPLTENSHKENEMNVTDRTTATKRVPMGSLRKSALAAGILYLATFVSIPILALYAPVLTDPNWVNGPGPDTPVLIGGVLEVIVALAGIGTAIALFPVVKRQNEGVALGFVGARVLEAAALFAGVVALLSVVTLRQSGAGADAMVAGQTLAAQYGWSFLLGGSLMPAINALLLGSLLYRSRLVPRILPLLGMIGAPLLLASDFAVLFGLWDRVSLQSGIAAIPIAVWEFSLGVYLIVKGFKPSPITADMTAATARPAYQDTAA